MNDALGDRAAVTMTDSAWRILHAATSGQQLPVRLRTVLRLVVCPLDRLTQLVPRKARLFDVGCGTGAFLALIARRREPVALYGSELSAVAGANAAAALGNLAVNIPFRIFETGDPVSTGVLGDCDVVTLVDVLHHIPPCEQQAFVACIAAALPAGGLLLLKEIDRSHRLGAWANRLHDRVFSGAAGHERSAATLEGWLRDCGLTIELRRNAWRLWYPHVTFVARKLAHESAPTAL